MSFVHGILQILHLIMAGLGHLRIGELDIPLVDLVLQLSFTCVQKIPLELFDPFKDARP